MKRDGEPAGKLQGELDTSYSSRCCVNKGWLLREGPTVSGSVTEIGEAGLPFIPR